MREHRWVVQLKLWAATIVMLNGCGGGGGMTPPPPSGGPSIASISPSGMYAGFGGFPLTVNGSGFVTSSVVQWNGSGRATTFVGSSQLMAQVLSSDLTTAGIANITVANPSPGGGTSNALLFMIPPGPAPGTGVIEMISVAVDGSPSNGNSLTPPAISADGRFVAFQSDATNLVPGPNSGFSDIYVRDACLGAASPCTPTTVRVSVATDGTLANGNSRSPSISADGRFVAFDSSASNLVPGDTNGQIGQMTGLADVFIRDTCFGAPPGCLPSTTRVSVASDGSEASGDSRNPSVSADSRFVTFNSTASNLVSGDTNGLIDVFLRDTCLGVLSGCIPGTTIVSVASNGTQGDSHSFFQSISGGGRFVAWHSFAANLVPGDTNGQPDVFVRDVCFGATAGCVPATIRASVAANGSQSNERDELFPSISADGRFVVFTSFANNLVPGDTNDRADIFVRDTCVSGAAACTPDTARVSIAFQGAQADNGSFEHSISGDGRLVAFSSLAGNLLPSGPTLPKHIYLRDTCQGAPTNCIPTTILLSVTPDRFIGDGISELPAISADGRFVVFRSTSTNLVPGGSNGNLQIFLARTGF